MIFLSLNMPHIVTTAMLNVAFVLPPILAVIAVIIGWKSLRRINSGLTTTGKARSTSGIIIGFATLAYTASSWFVSFFASYLLRDY